MDAFDTLVAQIRAKRDHYELIVRKALREAVYDNPSLLAGNCTVTDFVELHLYNLEDLLLDEDPGLKWCSGQMFAADELMRFAELLQADNNSVQAATPSPAPVDSSPPPSAPSKPAPHMTVESARAAATSSGAICPACGAGDAVETDVDEVEGTWYQRKVCGACSAGWTNVWEFSRLMVFGPGGEPDVYERVPARTCPRVRTGPEEWTQQPDGQWTHAHRPRTVGEVWDEIKAALPAYGIDLNDFDYAGPTFSTDRNRPFPQGYRWLACFNVRGDSEGHYTHVSSVSTIPDGTQVLETIFIAKTFGGWENANALANALAVMLDD